jgi:RND family efflux transporter MFP subunit
MKKLFYIIYILSSITVLSCSEQKESKAKEQSTSYRLVVVKQQAIANSLRLPAQLVAYQMVAIYPKVTGYIKQIPVDIGSLVHEGQLIMQMEAPEVEQNNLAAQATYFKAVASYKASKDSYSRLLTASKTAGAVSPNDLQTVLSKMQADSSLCSSEKARWKAMESLKDYLLVKAPFAGTITQRNIDPGALVTAGNKSEKPLLELQQVSRLRLQVKVPESFATQLQANQKVDFTVEALPGRTFTGSISRLANALDEKYRSESVEIDVINTDNTLLPGMYAELVLPVRGHQNAFVVPQTAVITSTEKKYLIVVTNKKAHLVDVSCGNEHNGMIEVFGALSSGQSIVAKADEDIKEGQEL